MFNLSLLTSDFYAFAVRGLFFQGFTRSSLLVYITSSTLVISGLVLYCTAPVRQTAAERDRQLPPLPLYTSLSSNLAAQPLDALDAAQACSWRSQDPPPHSMRTAPLPLAQPPTAAAAARDASTDESSSCDMHAVPRGAARGNPGAAAAAARACKDAACTDEAAHGTVAGAATCMRKGSLHSQGALACATMHAYCGREVGEVVLAGCCSLGAEDKLPPSDSCAFSGEPRGGRPVRPGNVPPRVAQHSGTTQPDAGRKDVRMYADASLEDMARVEDAGEPAEEAGDDIALLAQRSDCAAAAYRR
jgi:hypothetical protein